MTRSNSSPHLPSAYEELGGSMAVQSLVNRFYDLVESEADAAPLRVLHGRGHGFPHARQAQFLFLSGFLGGPNLYREHNGHADILAMHAHVVIDPMSRDAWLSCMSKALAAEGVAPHLASRLMTSFTRIADRILLHTQQDPTP